MIQTHKTVVLHRPEIQSLYRSRGHVTWKITLKAPPVCFLSWCSHFSFKSCFLRRSSSCCKLPLLLLPLFSPQQFRMRDGSVCPLHTNDLGVFPLRSSESSRLLLRPCVADDTNTHSFSVSDRQPASVSFSWCWEAPGSFSSSEIVAEASECPRPEIKPSSRLGGDVHESIRRPGSWGNPEMLRWRPEETGQSTWTLFITCFLTLLTPRLCLCALRSPWYQTPEEVKSPLFLIFRFSPVHLHEQHSRTQQVKSSVKHVSGKES